MLLLISVGSRRVALGVAGDDPAAIHAVMAFVDAVGFDPVRTGTLGHSAMLHPGTVLFEAAADLEERLRGCWAQVPLVSG